MYAAYFVDKICSQEQIDEMSFEIRLICQPMAQLAVFTRLVTVCYHAKDKA
jgi:hypothetical protein